MDQKQSLNRQHFPFIPGAAWTFKATTGEDAELCPMEARLPEQGPGVLVTDLFEPSRDIYVGYEVRDDGLYVTAMANGPDALFHAPEPTKILPFPTAGGARNDATVLLRNSLSLAGEPVEATFSILVDGPLTVDTPAGVFEGCFLTVMHQQMGDRSASTRVWWAPSLGPVKGEALTEEGLLKQVELLCARIGQQETGDMTLALDFDFFEAKHRILAGEAEAGEPITLGDIVQGIRPLNVGLQRIEGLCLVEIQTRGQTCLVFADPDDPAFPPVEVRLVRNAALARRYAGRRLAAGAYLALLKPGDHNPDALPRVHRLFRKVAGLLAYNTALPDPRR